MLNPSFADRAGIHSRLNANLILGRRERGLCEAGPARSPAPRRNRALAEFQRPEVLPAREKNGFLCKGAIARFIRL
jgi:hypothetical protein